MSTGVTQVAKANQPRVWHIISARDQILGRLAVNVARLLMGKHKNTYTPNIDVGDYVVITDASQVKVTGKKSSQKTYQRYSGYPAGLHTTTYLKMSEKHPDQVIRLAIAGMLPDNRLKSKRLARLKIFVGSEHPYQDKFKIKN